MEPAAISASPARTTMWLLSTAPESPAAKREGHGQAIRHADDDVADDFARSEVALNVWCLRHRLLARDGLPRIAARCSTTSRSP